MRRFLLLVPLAFVLALVLGGTAQADRNGITRFATLPSGPGHPEGIAADPAGNIYAATFSFTPPNYVYKFDRSGRLVATVTLPASVPLGMQWGPDNKLYVDDFGNGNVLQFTPPITNASTPSRVYHVCSGGGVSCAVAASMPGGIQLATSELRRARGVRCGLGGSTQRGRPPALPV